MSNVISLAAARAARTTPLCSCEIFGDLRRAQLSDIVNVGITCEGAVLEAMLAQATEASASAQDAWARRFPIFEFETGERRFDAAPMPSVTAEQDPSGSWWVEAYMTLDSALRLQEVCAVITTGRKAG